MGLSEKIKATEMAMSHLFLSSPRLSLSLPTQDNKDCKIFKVGIEATRVSKRFLCRSINMESGHSGEPKKLSFDNLLRKTKDVWNSSPQPVKEFPWSRAFDNFIQLVLDLAISVVKLLFVPILAVSSVSEMSYCAHERKLVLVPFPLILGFVVAGILQDTALKMSPRLEEAEVPWHLIAMMMFFTLIKLPGPYYPYWGRLVVPHFANGVLFRALWSMFFWYKKTRSTSTISLQNHSTETK